MWAGATTPFFLLLLYRCQQSLSSIRLAIPTLLCGPEITLEEIGRITEEGRVRELPGFVPYSTVDALINRHKGAWDIHIDDAADAVAANLEEVLLESVEEVFGRFPAASVAVRCSGRLRAPERHRSTLSNRLSLNSSLSPLAPAIHAPKLNPHLQRDCTGRA